MAGPPPAVGVGAAVSASHSARSLVSYHEQAAGDGRTDAAMSRAQYHVLTNFDDIDNKKIIKVIIIYTSTDIIFLVYINTLYKCVLANDKNVEEMLKS